MKVSTPNNQMTEEIRNLGFGDMIENENYVSHYKLENNLLHIHFKEFPFYRKLERKLDLYFGDIFKNEHITLVGNSFSYDEQGNGNLIDRSISFKFHDVETKERVRQSIIDAKTEFNEKLNRELMLVFDKNNVTDKESFLKLVTLGIRHINVYTKSKKYKERKKLYKVKYAYVRLLSHFDAFTNVTKQFVNHKFMYYFETNVIDPHLGTNITFHVPMDTVTLKNKEVEENTDPFSVLFDYNTYPVDIDMINVLINNVGKLCTRDFIKKSFSQEEMV